MLKVLRWLTLAIIPFGPFLYILAGCGLLGAYVVYGAWCMRLLTNHGIPFWLAVILSLIVIPVVVAIPVGLVGSVLFSGMAERLKLWVDECLRD